MLIQIILFSYFFLCSVINQTFKIAVTVELEFEVCVSFDLIFTYLYLLKQQYCRGKFF